MKASSTVPLVSETLRVAASIERTGGASSSVIVTVASPSGSPVAAETRAVVATIVAVNDSDGAGSKIWSSLRLTVRSTPVSPAGIVNAVAAGIAVKSLSGAVAADFAVPSVVDQVPATLMPAGRLSLSETRRVAAASPSLTVTSATESVAVSASVTVTVAVARVTVTRGTAVAITTMKFSLASSVWSSVMSTSTVAVVPPSRIVKLPLVTAV